MINIREMDTVEVVSAEIYKVVSNTYYLNGWLLLFEWLAVSEPTKCGQTARCITVLLDLFCYPG